MSVDLHALIPLIALTFLLAGFVKGVVGLGLPTVSVGLLGLAMPPMQAAALLIVPSMVTNLWQLACGPRFLGLMKRLAGLLLGVIVGTLLVGAWLGGDAPRQATGVLGLALAAYALLGLAAIPLHLPARHEPWAGPLVGLTTGALTAVTGVFVIPAVPYDPAPLGQTPADKPQQQTPVADAEQDGGERPLLMPGKKTLFQRVLTKPGAAISAEAGGPPRAGAVPAFSVLYVYARKQVGGSPWLRVGASSNGEGDGWLPASAVSDWKQSLVLKFTERSGRAPVMFLNSAEQVERLLGDTRAARDTLTQAVDHKGDPQVVAVEPNDRAIPQDQFYLLPIFDSKESFDADGQPAQLLEVASIDPGGSAAAPQAPGQAGPSATTCACACWRTCNGCRWTGSVARARTAWRASWSRTCGPCTN